MTKTTVYIESIGKYPSDDWTYSAFIGYRNRGADIKLFEDIKEVPLRRDVMLVACIESTHYWFEQMGWKIPESITMPINLRQDIFLGRQWQVGEKRLAQHRSVYPFFTKPYETKKNFTADIIHKEEDKQFVWKDVPDDQLVVTSGVLDFKSEWRVYMLRNEILGCCNYGGEHLIFPDSLAIKAMGYVAPSLHDFPCAFSLDVGVVLEDGEYKTYLVECNDFYALGNYGLSPQLYTRALSARWRQLLEQNPVI